MLTNTLANLFTRDLTKLKTEIEAYSNESILWDTELGISNSAGNLCLHLIGNLNGFIGSELGNSGYKRERALEFTLKNIPRAELLEKIDATINIVNKVLSELSNEQLESEYPILVFKEKTTTEFFLLHLAGHLSYHLGQINYHRRLLDK